MTWEVRVGDCNAVMEALAVDSVDAVVCDPPYGLEFMGRDWDRLGDARQPGDDNYTPGPGPFGRAKVRYGGSPSYGEGRLSMPGIGDRATPWVNSRGWNGTRCSNCGHLSHGGSPCNCDNPEFVVADDRWLRMQDWHYQWSRKVYRVLKPGGYLLAFGGTRTYHRMVCAIEDAGFEIRDSIHWLYGSGFPKSLDVSKALDARAGVERTEVVGVKPGHEDFVERTDAHAGGGISEGWHSPWKDDPEAVARSHQRLAPVTELAVAYDGWGTALKPGHEPVVVARKPLIGTVADNVAVHGTGGINVDGCRVEGRARPLRIAHCEDTDGKNTYGSGVWGGGSEAAGETSLGRWPTNLVLTHSVGCRQVGEATIRADGHYPAERGPSGDFAGAGGGLNGQQELAERHVGLEVVPVWDCIDGCPVAELDHQSGDRPAGGRLKGTEPSHTGQYGIYGAYGRREWQSYDDSGGASRFFPIFNYVAKAARSERNAGMNDGTNNHPTVKPIELMRWLVRLVTPKEGTVLDPFCGSGTTGIACVAEDFNFIGIEQKDDYAAIARQRIAHAEAQPRALTLFDMGAYE